MASESPSTPLSSGGSTGGELWRSLAAAQTEIGQLRADLKSLSGKIEERDRAISQLKAENDRLRSAGGSHDRSVGKGGQEGEVKESSLSPAMDEEVTKEETPESGREGAGRRVLLSISEEHSSPQRRRVMTAEDVSASPRDGSTFRSRATTVSTEKVFSERSKRPSKNRDLLQLPPSPLSLPRRKRSSVKHSNAAYPIASDMEEKLIGKIKEEIGRQYGGLSRATPAAITIQRWYRAVHMRRHYRMLHNMATRQPKKLRQRTQSMRQSRRFRKGSSQEGAPKHGVIRKQVSILDDFPNLKEVTDRVATPRSARRRDAKNTLSLVTEEQRVDFSQGAPRTQASVRKVQVTPNVPTPPVPIERAPIETSVSMEESLSMSIMSQLRPGAISEFEVFEGGATERSRRESATTMRRKMNIGINYFNRKPWKGLVYLVQRKILEDSPAHVANFLLSRLDLSKVRIGEFLSYIQRDFNMSVLDEMVNSMNFQNKTVDEALRVFQAHFQISGEAQKIEKIVEAFANGYYEANLDLDVFANSDTVFILSYAIMMLNTDLHNPCVKKHLTRPEWISMNRGIDNGEDLPTEFLVGIYERIQKNPFMTARDHTHELDSLEKSIAGCPPIVLTYRQLLFKCRVDEVEEDRLRSHQRFIFVFNDILLVTKPRRQDLYQFRTQVPLLGAIILKFETSGHRFGVDVHCSITSRPLFMCSCDSEQTRTKLVKHLQDAVAEVDEIERERIAARDSGGRGSPGNLSAMEAPEFPTKSAEEFQSGKMMRSGSVPDDIFTSVSDSQLEHVDGPVLVVPPLQPTESPTSPPQPATSNGISHSLPPPQVGVEPDRTQSACSSPVERLTESVDENRARTLGRVDQSPVKHVRTHSGASPSKVLNWFRRKKVDKTVSTPHGH